MFGKAVIDLQTVNVMVAAQATTARNIGTEQISFTDCTINDVSKVLCDWLKILPTFTFEFIPVVMRKQFN